VTTALTRSCKVCQSEDRDQINTFLANRQSLRQVESWTRKQGRAITRPTLTKHLAHALDAESQFVQDAPPTQFSRVDSGEFLQSVVNVAATRVQAPGEVGVQEGLRAAQILEQKKESGRDGLRVLALVLMGREPDTIEGEYRELPA
jgi:hypothetical protein